MNQSDMLPPSRHRDEETVKLAKFLFHAMVGEENTPRHHVPYYQPEYFLRWVEQRMSHLDSAETCTAAGCDEVGWTFLGQLCRCREGTLLLQPLWYEVCLAHRDDPKNAVKRVQLVYLVTYEDGTIFPMHMNVPAELMVGRKIDDAFAATRVVEQSKAIVRLIQEHGLDGIHALFPANYGGEKPVEVMLGLVLQGLAKVDPSLHPQVNSYMRLVQGVLLPKNPPPLQQALAAQKRREEPPKQLPPGVPDLPGGFE